MWSVGLNITYFKMQIQATLLHVLKKLVYLYDQLTLWRNLSV